MPLLGTRGVASSRAFGLLSVGGNWLASANAGDSQTGIAVDATGNSYITGYSGGPSVAYTTKYDAVGNIVWQRSLTNTAPYGVRGTDIALDTSSNVYVVGWSNSAGVDGINIIKYNNSGVLQWQKRLTTSYSVAASALAIDAADNILIVGDGGPSVSYIVIAKLDSTGTLLWDRAVYDNFFNYYGVGVSTDSSNNVYCSGWQIGATGAPLIKLNSSGVLQWQRELLNNFAGFYANAVDSANNVYFLAKLTSPETLLLLKYNSSGALQWQRALTGATAQSARSMSIDTNNDIYIVGNVSGGTTGAVIAKYTSTGSLTWQRLLSDSSISLNSIAANNNQAIWVSGALQISAVANRFAAKLPVSGAKTGGYLLGGTSVSYSVPSLTDAAGTMTDGVAFLTDSAISFAVSNTTYVDAATTLTLNVTQI
jgi:hypothetical protein